MKNDFKIGIFFTTLGQYSNMLIQFLVTVVLSRLLTPEDFGIIAIVQVFLLLIMVFYLITQLFFLLFWVLYLVYLGILLVMSIRTMNINHYFYGCQL